MVTRTIPAGARHGPGVFRRAVLALLTGALLFGTVGTIGAVGTVGRAKPAQAQAQPAELPTSTLDAAPSQAWQLPWSNSFIAAQVSDIAYRDSADERAHLLAHWGLVEVGFFSGDRSSQVLFAEDQDHRFLFVGVRGTQETRDYILDLNVAWRAPSWDRRVSLHAGFANASDVVMGSIRERVAAANEAGRTVIVTGHSLGGAVAHIVGYRLDLEEADLHSIITFGAPNTGNAAWVDRYSDRLLDRTHDFQNNQDPIPCMPANPRRWQSLLGRHYHLETARVSVRNDEDACAPIISRADLDPTGFLDFIDQRCRRARRWVRRLINVFAPGLCGSILGDAGVGLLGNLWQFINGDTDAHEMTTYIARLRASLPEELVDSPLIRRPAQIQAVNPLGGGLMGVLHQRSGTAGWSSATSWTRDGRTFVAKVKHDEGLLRVQELDNASGATLRDVGDVRIAREMDIVGTYGPGPSHIVLAGAGFVQTRRIGSDNRVGGETGRTEGMPALFPLPDDAFVPERNVVYDIDGATGPKPAQLMAFDRELGEYRIRTLRADGRFGPVTAAGEVGFDGFEFLETHWIGGSQYVWLMSRRDGALQVRRMDDNGNPSTVVREIYPGAETLAGEYRPEPGWTSMTLYGTELGTFALLHNFRTGRTDRYSVAGDGQLAQRLDVTLWRPGWTTIEPVRPPGRIFLFAVRE
jgi:hypothetical protein